MKRLIALFTAALFAAQAHAITLGDRFMSSGYVAPPPTTLNLDFTAGVKPGGYSHSNASGNRTYYNVSGTLVAAAANIARLDYNPSTHAGSWLLYENSSTNLVYPSTPNNTAWLTSLGISTITVNSTTSPDGTTNATLLVENTATTPHYTNNGGSPTTAFTSGQAYTNSVYVKAGTATAVQLIFNGGIFGTNAYCNFNLSTGAVGTRGAAASNPFITDVGSGWYRIGFTSTATSSSSNIAFYLVLTNNNASAARLPSYTGTSKQLYAYGAQTEQSSSATSYIATTSATVTRAADIGSFWVPITMSTVTYTFDDNSTQNETGVTSGAYHTIPYTLNRKRIKTIVGS